MKHLEVLARQISAYNVSHIFGIPGSGPSLFLLDALEKHGIRFHAGLAAMDQRSRVCGCASQPRITRQDRRHMGRAALTASRQKSSSSFMVKL